MKRYFIYILASKNKVLYVGMTNELSRRIFEHKNGLVDGFTKRYNVIIWFIMKFNLILKVLLKEKNNLRIGTDNGR